MDRFRQLVETYYAQHGRHDLPWRRPDAGGRFDPYHILVSELMLQQTQVSRVIPKFDSFLRAFPTVDTLAVAPLAAVLREWSGLGYNRRAKFLWQAARQLVDSFGGQLPDTLSALTALPGVGPNTAGAVLAYAFDQPAVFVETNVRTVFIHHFCAGQAQVPDRHIAQLCAQALAQPGQLSPRQWYWALMDYGTHLKQTHGNAARAARAYARQPAFKGSRRQVRGGVLRELARQPLTSAQLQRALPDDRLPLVLADLLREELIQLKDNSYQLAGA